MKWYLDLFTKRTDGGHEVIGIPHRWTMNANWKYPADNFSADGLHAAFVHGSLMEIGLVPSGAGSAGAWSVCLNNGHALWLNFAHPDVPVLSARSYPALMESVRRNLSPKQVEIYTKAPYHGGTVFPNFSYIDAAFPPTSGGESVNYTSLRVWQPVARDRIEILSWFLVEKAAPQEFKEASYHAYISNFCPSGVFEQDDAQVWCGATQTVKGPMGRSLVQNISGGIHYQPDRSFPGPGDAVDNSFFEVSQRSFYRKWLDCMCEPVDSGPVFDG
jgi:PAH dioxygenase large subunit